jgi:hypothetical protein
MIVMRISEDAFRALPDGAAGRGAAAGQRASQLAEPRPALVVPGPDRNLRYQFENRLGP